MGPEGETLVGQQVGEFEILELLGAGGMGAVYKARQTSLGRFVALKTLQPGLAWDEKDIARFRQEAKAAARLNHPNLVQVYSAGETNGLHWFAMEYVEGESAMARLERKGRLAPQEAIAIVTHVATALDYGWRKAGLIHRDVKPDNIFLSQAGEVKLGDLGVAKNAEQTAAQTGTGASIGTPNYMSPEQIEGKKDVDLRSDIYSLGCTLYHLLSGRPPFEAKSATAVMLEHLSAPVPDLRKTWPACAPELAAGLEKMMQKEPAARQQSYDEVGADLQLAFQGLSGARVPSVVAMTHPPANRGKGMAAGATRRTAPAALWIGGAVAICAAVWALLYFGPWKKAGVASERTAANGARKPPLAFPPTRAAAGTPASSGLKPRASKDSSMQTTVCFINHSGKQARLFWIDFEGRRLDYGLLEPGESHMEITYTGHVWWVEGADGKPLATFEVGEASIDAVLTTSGQLELTTKSTPTPTATAKSETDTHADLHSEQEAPALITPVALSSTQKTTPPSATAKWLGELAPQWRAAFANEVATPFGKGVDDLKQRYLVALATKSAAAISKRLLDESASFLAEQKRIGEGGSVPDVDEPSDPPALKSLRAAYHKSLAALDSQRANNAKIVIARYDAILAQNQALLIQHDRPAEALEVKAKRKQLAVGWLDPTAIASKDSPFVNSLGQEFVPVPITGGPTDSARSGVEVLFAVTDTTVSQFGKFVKVRGLNWEKPSFEQGPDHPAVNVSWEDANAFCDWLTSEDRKSVKLPAGAKYRLPSDHEWSCAIGIGTREQAEASPKEKDAKIAGYPWGDEWPPTKGSGNYSDAALKREHPDWNTIDGYDDGYPYTSPVKAFRPNAFGLHDMGGNVRQMCLDKYDPADQSATASRVLRGGSWDSVDEINARSSRRYDFPTHRFESIGFRCVLVVSGAFRPTIGLSAPPDSASSATLSTATAEMPFVNSLTQEFVPVPITGGPTAGQRILFCRWTTRVADFRAFVKAESAYHYGSGEDPSTVSVEGWKKTPGRSWENPWVSPKRGLPGDMRELGGCETLLRVADGA